MSPNLDKGAPASASEHCPGARTCAARFRRSARCWRTQSLAATARFCEVPRPQRCWAAARGWRWWFFSGWGGRWRATRWWRPSGPATFVGLGGRRASAHEATVRLTLEKMWSRGDAGKFSTADLPSSPLLSRLSEVAARQVATAAKAAKTWHKIGLIPCLAPCCALTKQDKCSA